MIPPLMTEWFRFLGMNIKGTPSMKADAVAHDLAVGKRKSSVLVVQEFRWPWYWTTARRVMGRGKRRKAHWGSSPNFTSGTVAPVRGAQAVFWARALWKKSRTRVRLLHWGRAKISENRFLRAVRLTDRATAVLSCWFLTTHFVVKGDERSDTQPRRDMMAKDLKAFDKFLTALVKTGYPVMGQMDANIHRGSEAYREFMAILKRHGARVYGEHGVEFLFVIDGRDIEVEVKDDWTLPVSRLRTDHEGRGVTARLVQRSAA